MKKTLILGLGNPILTDDGIGIHVVRALEKGSLPPGVECAEASVGGLRLLSVIAGYQRVILVDAIQRPGGRPGDLFRFRPDELQTSRHAGSAHDLSLPGALNLGRSLGMDVPADDDIVILAIQAEDVLTLGEETTPAVKAAIPKAVEAILGELAQ
ncbi:MAG TPA: hydrogenase maturation protease [Thermodesulfobacteriota bacterium]|nr:hydrogenase maturation protease [Thermodesulfobacteriota bacterium]